MRISRHKLIDLYNKFYNITTADKIIYTQNNFYYKYAKNCILFCDELNRAPIDVRQTALQLVLEKQIHEHFLPTVNGQRTLIVSAINPSDEYQVDELDPALLSRFLTIDVEPDVKAWLKWAKSVNLNEYVYNFISEFPDRLWFQAADGRGSDPRSWEKLAKFMDKKDQIKPEILYEIMAGKIGVEIGSQFYAYVKDYVNIVKVKDIEEIVNEYANTVTNIEELAEIIERKIEKMEANLKMDLAEQLFDKYKFKKDMLPLLAYYYALPTELCLAHLKSIRKDDPESYRNIVDFDVNVNNKKLFIRFAQASDAR